MSRRTLLLLGIALLVVLTSWLSQQQGQPGKSGTESANLPDYFIKGFSSSVTDEQGQISQRLDADTLTHYPDNDLTTLARPNITVINTDGANWHATAEYGELSGGDERKLLLRDQVVLRQQGNESLTLHTDWLRIEGERRYAETDAPIVIESAKGRIEGVGLNLYGKEQRLLVRSEVRGQYEAN